MSEPARGASSRGTFELRLFALALAGTVPLALALALFVFGGPATGWRLFGVFAALAWAFVWPWLLVRRLGYSLNTLINLLGALREGDFSVRGRLREDGGAMAAVLAEVNALGSMLREQRLGALEATALAHRVIDALDAAVFAFDGSGNLRLVNRAGERLLARPGEELLGRPADAVGLADLLTGEPARLVERGFPGRRARWDVRRSHFRKDGLPVTLLVLSDVSRSLRAEERGAWKRLIRVLGHELNNSLAAIKSIAGTLGQLLTREPRPADWEEDAAGGLARIGQRSEALARFLGAYSRLAKLPPPVLRPVVVAELVERAAALESRVAVQVAGGPALRVAADPDQLEQALINLITNAAEAHLEAGAKTPVRIGWHLVGGEPAALELWVEDDGPGLANPENLFVPFYTTKREGSGIGLVLAREVAEAHGGSVVLENRPGAGCVARLRIPGDPR